MSIDRIRATVVALFALVAIAVGLSACGGSGGSDSTAAETATAPAAEEENAASTEEASTEEAGAEEAGGEDAVAAAKEAIAPFVGQPSPFSVTEKLKEVPKGATIAYMDCGTPICALFWELLGPAAQTMGVKVERVKAGSAANTVSAAFDSVVAKKPDAVIVTAINVELWKNQLEELQAANVPIVTTGITGTEPYGIEAPQAAEPEVTRDGKLLANYVLAEFGPQSKVAVYEVPELPFTGIEAEMFTEELEAICPECSARVVQIPVATLGNTAPNTVVSDLQANPDTTVAAFMTDEIENGLPTALAAAGIKVKTIGANASPTNLQYIKEGKETAALSVDLPILTWTLLDQAAREITGQKLSGEEAKGLAVAQFLTQKDITFDPSKGWTGYPDFAERFAKLWGAGG